MSGAGTLSSETRSTVSAHGRGTTMFTRTTRRGISAVALVTAGLALTACGSSDNTSSSSASVSSTATPSAPAATSDSSDSSSADSTVAQPASSSAANSGSSTVPACATSDLKTTAEGVNSGAGHTDFQIVFQNTGSAACTLTGYPGVSFVKAHNVQLGKAATRTTGTTTVVTLIPNAHAYADAQTVNGVAGYSAAQCDLTSVPTLRVYPPN